MLILSGLEPSVFSKKLRALDFSFRIIFPVQDPFRNNKSAQIIRVNLLKPVLWFVAKYKAEQGF